MSLRTGGRLPRRRDWSSCRAREQWQPPRLGRKKAGIRSRESKNYEELPLTPAEDLPPPAEPPRLAPAWVPLASAWIGLLAMLLSFAIPFVPGTQNPQAELTHATAYSWADRLMLAMYIQATALFLGIITLWQTRREARQKTAAASACMHPPSSRSLPAAWLA